MKTFCISLLISVPTLLFLANCAEKQPEPNPALANIELKRGDIILCSGKELELGEVSFPLSCKSSTKKNFNLAMSLLHSFEYDEAEKAFAKVIDADPECAMGYWGVAMSIYHTLWTPPTEKDMEKGAKMLEIAAQLPKSGREQEYLDAIGAYYENWKNVDAKTRAANMTQKMKAIHEKYKDDTEAAILYALALNSIADPTDKNYTNQRQAGSILEGLMPNQPNHPGIAHYIIHSYDNPVLAERALPVARKYAGIAPASSHAQHMPSHIFVRLGLWEECINSNKNAAISAVCYAESAGMQGHWDEELHALDYLVYAYLQKGDNASAMEQHDYLNSMKKINPINFKVVYAAAAIPARIALENKDWEKAATLQPSTIDIAWEQFPWQKAILHFTRALGASHTGRINDAEKEIQTLQTIHQKFVEAEKKYEANQVWVQLNSAKAWLHHAKGKNEEAIVLLQAAADMEDNTSKRPVTPGEVLPAREMLGDLYLAINKPAEALKAYETTMKNSPKRFNTLYGAAFASKQLGNQDAAKGYFEQLMKLSAAVEERRPELIEAEDFLAKS